MCDSVLSRVSLLSKLQAVLLQQQSFLQKCEDWMDFLSQTEQKLAAETSGNYHSLLEQQRDHEVRIGGGREVRGVGGGGCQGRDGG